MGRSLAPVSSRPAVRFAFEERGFARVAASADAPNLASIRVMEKAGLRFDKRVTLHGLDTVFHALPRAAYKPDGAPYVLRRLQRPPVLRASTPFATIPPSL